MRPDGSGRRYWSADDVAWLRANYGLLRAEGCAERLGVTRRAVARKASVLGLRLDKRTRGEIGRASWLSSRRRMRVRKLAGLPVGRHMPVRKYTPRQLDMRYRLRCKGYVLGDFRDALDRYKVYYDVETERNKLMERNGPRMGFIFEELAED